MICLDNDVFTRYASRASYPAVDRYLADHVNEPWAVPALVLFEYLNQFGSHDSIRIERENAVDAVDTVLVFDADVAQEAANLGARLATTGTSLDLADLLIAATARANGATLVTRNSNDFDKAPIHELLDVDLVG
jgi:predicted nucleic acid-binding protein